MLNGAGGNYTLIRIPHIFLSSIQVIQKQSIINLYTVALIDIAMMYAKKYFLSFIKIHYYEIK